MSEVKKLTKNDTKVWLEGEELIRLFYKSKELMFGTSFMNPNTKGDIDPGHTGWEVFYVAKGYLMIHLPETDEYFEVNEGESLLMPPRVSHMFYNPSDMASLIVWAAHKPDLE